MMTTRCNRAEVVFLWSEANRVNTLINSSERKQFQNARVFSEGGAEGFDNNAERRSDELMSYATNVSRAVKDDI